MKSCLHIDISLREHRSILKTVYATTPYKLADITENKKAGALELMIMSSSPGILDGDEHELRVNLQAGTIVNLHTQSYQRLFNMKQSASLALTVKMEPNSILSFIPHPIVPHKSSSFTVNNKIYVGKNCTLLFSEILTCGRNLNGEIFSFTKYHNLTEIYLDDKLVIKENIRLEPGTINFGAIGQLEGFTHQASLVYLREDLDIPYTNKLLTDLLEKEEGILFGVTEAPVSGLFCRLLGYKAEQLYKCIKTIADVLAPTHFIKKGVLC